MYKQLNQWVFMLLQNLLVINYQTIILLDFLKAIKPLSSQSLIEKS